MTNMYSHDTKPITKSVTEEQKKIVVLEAKYAMILEKMAILEAKLVATERSLRRSNTDLANIISTLNRRR